VRTQIRQCGICEGRGKAGIGLLQEYFGFSLQQFHSMLHPHIYVTHHQHHLTLATDTVVKTMAPPKNVLLVNTLRTGDADLRF